MVDMHRALALLRDLKQALYNVPPVGCVYDQQHSDTHLEACVEIDRFLRDAGHNS